jgi:hypothetical protein
MNVDLHSALAWPFFDERHRVLARDVDAWAHTHLKHVDHADTDAACKRLVRMLGDAGWLKHCVGGTQYGASNESIDTRAVCLLR